MLTCLYLNPHTGDTRSAVYATGFLGSRELSDYSLYLAANFQ
jgi:hypothetical protein